MKRIIAAAMATLTLCSCSLSDGETEMSSEIPEETTTFVFTGVPEMPALDFSGGASHTTAAENTAPEETSAADEENSSGEETPAEGTVPTATLNGSSVALTENDGVYTGTFQMPSGNATLAINSGGATGGGSGDMN